MSKLISGKEALIAWFDGKKIEVKHLTTKWYDFNSHNFGIDIFKSNEHQFRLKPQTITINGIDIAKPKKIDLTNIFTITMEFDDHNEAIKANKAIKSIFKPQ